MPPAAPSVSQRLIDLFEATTASTEERPDPRAILVRAQDASSAELTNTAAFAPQQSDSADFAPALRQLLADEPNKSAYVLYRLDTTAASGSWEWILCAYQPPTAPVREKMRYNQTRAALFSALHELNFLDTLFGQTPAEFTFPTQLRNARKVDYQNPNVGLQGRTPAQAAGAGTGGVRRNFGQVGKPAPAVPASHVPTAMPTSAPVPASAARPTKSYAGAAPTPFSSATPAAAPAAMQATPEPGPESASTMTKQDAIPEAVEESQPAPPAASEPESSNAIPLPKTAALAGEQADDDDDDDGWDGPAAMQDSRVPSPVHVGHVAEAPKLETVNEELAAVAAAQQSSGVGDDEAAAAAAPSSQADAPEARSSSVNKDSEAEAVAPPEPEPVTPVVERPSEPIAAVLESAPTVPALDSTAEDEAPLDTSNGVIASVEDAEEAAPAPQEDSNASSKEEVTPLSAAALAPASLATPKTPGAGSDSASLIVEPPTPAPARVDPEQGEIRGEAADARAEGAGEIASASVSAPAPAPAPEATTPTPSSAAPISVSGYGTKTSASLLTEQEAARAEVDRAMAAERAAAASASLPAHKTGLGPGHTVLSFEWEEEVLPALSALPIRASGASEFNFVLLSLHLTPGEERVELAAPPRFLPAAEVGPALAAEGGPRYVLYRLEGTPVFEDEGVGVAASAAPSATAKTTTTTNTDNGTSVPSPSPNLSGGGARRPSTGPISTTGGGLLFIYSCPSSSTVRERMLYSANLRSFVLLAEQRVAGLRIQKKVETSDPAELTASYLAAELERATASHSSSSNGSASSGGGGGSGVSNGAAAAAAAVEGGTTLLGSSTTQAFARPKRPGGAAKR